MSIRLARAIDYNLYLKSLVSISVMACNNLCFRDLLYSTDFTTLDYLFSQKSVRKGASIGSVTHTRRLIHYILLDKCENVKDFNHVKTQLPQSYLGLINIFKNIVRRQRRCMFKGKLDLYCPLPPDDITCLTELIGYDTPVLKLSQCMVSILKFVLGKDFFGSENNTRKFFNNLKVFIKSKQWDDFVVKDFTYGVIVTEIQWLKKLKGNNKLFYKIISWIIKDLLMVIIRRYFHATVKQGCRNKLFYYRRALWRKITEIEIKKLITSPGWEKVSNDQAQNCILHTTKFIPKHSGTRLILKRDKTGNKEISTITDTEVFKLLKQLCSHYPEIIASSGLGVIDIHKKCKKGFKCMDYKNTYVYYVKVDVSKCFDSILLDKLLLILQDIFTKYSKHGKILCGNKEYSVETLSSHIKKGLHNNVIEVKGEIYRKTVGIIQGWKLSALLCNLYYASLEIEHLQPLLQQSTPDETVLTRVLDDSLLITTNRNIAVKFLRLYAIGFPDYGFYTKPEKSAVNFPLDYTGINGYQDIEVIDSGPFPFFGFNFHFGLQHGKKNDLHGIALDLSKYSKCSSIRDVMSVNTADWNYQIAVITATQFRLNAICLDSSLNSKYRVLRNIYEVACIASLQWHAYLKVSKDAKWRVILNTISKKMPVEFKSTFQGVWNIVRERSKAKWITREMVLWLCYKSFLKQLPQQAEFKKLIPVFKNEIKNVKKDISGNKYLHLLHRAASVFPVELKYVKTK